MEQVPEQLNKEEEITDLKDMKAREYIAKALRNEGEIKSRSKLLLVFALSASLLGNVAQFAMTKGALAVANRAIDNYEEIYEENIAMKEEKEKIIKEVKRMTEDIRGLNREFEETKETKETEEN